MQLFNDFLDIYAGSKGGSELETQAIQNAILANMGNWEAFLTLHSFGGYWYSNFYLNSGLFKTKFSNCFN